MRKTQVLNCSFSKWYQDFRSVTVRSRVIDLPDEVVKYLLSDVLVLPRGEGNDLDRHLYGASESEDEVEWDDTVRTVEGPDFGELNAKIRDYVAQLDGAVVPKLNWSAPRDATWINFNNSLRCTTPADIFLLLKSSDFVTHDLSDPFSDCDDAECSSDAFTYQLILRKWIDIAPQEEFRCFVVNDCLVGISQRHHTICFPSLNNDHKTIADDIQRFFDVSIRHRFPDSDFVFDVYRKADRKVILLDFNPFGTVTDGLLFEWEELFKMAESFNNATKLDFRFVESECGIKPHPYQCYAIPQDFVHLMSGLDPAKFTDLLHLEIQKNDGLSSDDDDDDS